MKHPKTRWLTTTITFSLFFKLTGLSQTVLSVGLLGGWLQAASSWCWNISKASSLTSLVRPVNAGCGLRPYIRLLPITCTHGLSTWLLHVCSASSWHGTCISKASAWLLSPCLTLCDPVDCNPLCSSVYGISQARILEWIAISYSRRSSWPGIKLMSLVSSALEGGCFTIVPQ